ncbi:MAG: N-6 DNA methylase, partial [Patescibacteria group bacterium]
MGRSTVHYADNETNNILKRLHNKLRPAGTPVERVEYIIELLLLRIFESKLKQEESFTPLRKLFEGENYRLLFSHLLSLTGEQVLSELNKNIFPFYAAILNKAGQMIIGNMPTKMQDQLVLMEEVFANSNFTNNVKGGVIAEVIGLVNEIEEKWILKTDLLGDAIESALSETGGTKDLGLNRTPDHIRKMMVEMVDPNFIDTVFDPACGTAGFLFDTYEYVIEKARKTRQFPPEHIANQFYRVGIGGTEYQGRIRKMAAVNMYIRGLNPHNIDQGDSLKMYDPAADAKSKSVVIANPPFGAERDQPAYPNVWEEYSRESETTILFVKLMFELLKQGGRCAVVVSEGFLTWGQRSACALRKLLLNSANLRAIISLPQGVFVSKSGQGAKTSILYFEKGKPTDFVWYCKIENDGFSMGTNRKPIDGSQIPELLELFREVKQAKKPKDTKYSFCIQREWIETLDPRAAERIKAEVKKQLTEKNKAKREKLIAELDERLARGKISKAMYEEKLWQFDNVVESQVDNEIAKTIEKAHSYHFNLQNYRSNLSEEQIKEWQETLKGIEAKNGSTIEKKYHELQTANPQSALLILASLDPKNALQMDIAREYLSKVDKDVLEKDERLERLETILKKGVQYPIVSLKKLIVVSEENFKPAQYPEQEFTVLGVSNQTGVFVNEKLRGADIRQTYFRAYKNQFCYNPYRVNVGSIGLCEFDIENQIISGAYNIFACKESELNPRYLEALFKTKKFLDYVNEKASGGVRMDFKIGYMQEWQIPLPPLEIQNEIVGKIERQKQIVEGAEKLNAIREIDFDLFKSFDLKHIEEFAELNPRKDIRLKEDAMISFVPMEAVDDIAGTILNSQQRQLKEVNKGYTYFRNGDIIFAKITPCMENGKSAVAENLINETGFGSTEFHVIRALMDKALPKYIYYILRTKHFRELAKEKMTGASGHKRVPESFLREFKWPLPPLEIQRQIVEKLDRQMQALNGVRLLKSEAEKRIEEILAGVWG